MGAQPLALVKAGWWQTTWWPSQWWQEDWWLEYGAVAVDVGGVRGRRVYVAPRKPKPDFPVELAHLLKDYLEVKLGENT